MILLSHPTANQNVRQAALALLEAHLLLELWTAVDWRDDTALAQFSALFPNVQRTLRRRSFPAALHPLTHSAPFREMARVLLSRAGFRSLTSGEHAPFSIDAVYRDMDRRVARRIRELPRARAVYAYDGGAIASFHSAKAAGLKCIYEEPIVYSRYVRQLHEEEAALHPAWRSTLPALRDSEEKLAQKETELAAADLVVVANQFARRTLIENARVTVPVRVIPYGAPEVVDRVLPNESKKLRAIFVGALSQAKGLGYILDAIAPLELHVELTLVGQRVSPNIPSRSTLDRHRWIPSLSHEALLGEIREHDVLLFPSLNEGFGLVILEAMSQGVPVITTPHTAGPDIIDHGIDGFIVPIRSAEAIREHLEALVRDRDRLFALKEGARAKAATLPWSLYRQRIAELAREVIAN